MARTKFRIVMAQQIVDTVLTTIAVIIWVANIIILPFAIRKFIKMRKTINEN